uniref:Uncharacterized protein n=1 Tax=Setaria italica TaxID=4555 RepID=K4AH20_SETIT
MPPLAHLAWPPPATPPWHHKRATELTAAGHTTTAQTLAPMTADASDGCHCRPGKCLDDASRRGMALEGVTIVVAGKGHSQYRKRRLLVQSNEVFMIDFISSI